MSPMISLKLFVCLFANLFKNSDFSRRVLLQQHCALPVPQRLPDIAICPTLFDTIE